MRKEEPTQIIFEHLDEKTEFYNWLNEASNDDGVKRARRLLQQSQSVNENTVSRGRLTESELNKIGSAIKKRNERDKRRRRHLISNGVLRGVRGSKEALPGARIARGLNRYNPPNVGGNGVELVTVNGKQVVVIKENQLKQRK